MDRVLDTHFVCGGCRTEIADAETRPFACPRRGDGGDHVLRRRFRSKSVHADLLAEALESRERQPFVRFRRLFHGWHLARACGMSDDDYVDRIRALDDRIAEVDGHGFVETPLRHHPDLTEALSGQVGQILVKNESGNVSGSHKARHLMHVAIWLEIGEALGSFSNDGAPLAIASCGNAALAAAVVARAMRRRLLVFVPPDADATVIERMRALEAEIQSCPRDESLHGDPCMHAFRDAVDGGALPFGCQGPENGLTIEGGLGLGYEILAQLRSRDSWPSDLVVQVGGGALGSGIFQAFLEAVDLGVEKRGLPRLHTVQTRGASPLRRAYDLLLEYRRLHPSDDASLLAHAAACRDEFMWAWETPPASYATGILDDETYDWLALVEGMLRSEGLATVAEESTLREAHRLAYRATGIDVCATGSSGLAGLMTLAQQDELGPESIALVLFTGARR